MPSSDKGDTQDIFQNRWYGHRIKKLLPEDDREVTTKKNSVLSFSSYNCRSIVNKTTGVLEHIKETDTDICFLQETFLKKNNKAKLQKLETMGLKSSQVLGTDGVEGLQPYFASIYL